MKKPLEALRNLVGCRTPEEMDGMSLGCETAWVVEGVNDPAKVFKALREVLPTGSILYFEGTSISSAFRVLLQGIQTERAARVRGGTIWPRPSIFHVPATVENCEKLTELANDCHGFEVCDHLHVYRENRMLLQWYDAWDDPIGLSADFSEGVVRRFCEITDGRFKQFDLKEL